MVMVRGKWKQRWRNLRQTLREEGFKYLNAISDNYKRDILSGTEILLKILGIYIPLCLPARRPS